jgi:hypothetical protein
MPLRSVRKTEYLGKVFETDSDNEVLYLFYYIRRFWESIYITFCRWQKTRAGGPF